MGTKIPQEEHSPLLAAEAIMSSYLDTEVRISVDDMSGGNKLDAATRLSYSSCISLMALRKACSAASRDESAPVLCFFLVGDVDRGSSVPLGRIGGNGLSVKFLEWLTVGFLEAGAIGGGRSAMLTARMPERC